MYCLDFGDDLDDVYGRFDHLQEAQKIFNEFGSTLVGVWMNFWLNEWLISVLMELMKVEKGEK